MLKLKTGLLSFLVNRVFGFETSYITSNIEICHAVNYLIMIFLRSNLFDDLIIGALF